MLLTSDPDGAIGVPDLGVHWISGYSPVSVIKIFFTEIARRMSCPVWPSWGNSAEIFLVIYKST
jgi:hypothetical protein